LARDFEQESEFVEQVVNINRVTKVVKGGKNFSFSALVVVGDGPDALRIGNASHLNARGRLFLGSVIDTAYMTTFLLVPVLLGLMAFLVLWQNP